MIRVLFAIAVATAALSQAAASVSIPAPQKAAICGKRASCIVTAMHKAGGASVAEVHFGLKDKPDDAPDNGCMLDSYDKHDGGTEYWLLGAAPLKLLALCNDGYGAAGVGEDHVKFGDNRMTHDEVGGSAWRWQSTEVFSLTPFRALSTDGCSFNDLGPDTGTQTVTDEVKFRATVIAKNPSAHFADDDGVGCPDTTPAMFAKPKPYPAPKTVMAFPVLAPENNALFQVPAGTTLGSCSTSLGTDGKSGFVTFGKPAAAGQAVELRLLSVNAGKTLIAQIYDPTPAKALPGKSWIGGSHLEVWAGGVDTSSGALKRRDLSQVAVDLDGTVHTVGKAVAPQVTRWQAKDARGRPVIVLLLSWSDASAFFVGGVSYSQSDNGKQARLVANTPLEHGVPVFVPDVVAMQGKCAIKNGRIEAP
jgi:hypothetical protein